MDLPLNTPVIFRVNEPQREKLNSFCKHNRITVSELLREYVEGLNGEVTSFPQKHAPTTKR
jgi:hypothetical protein